MARTWLSVTVELLGGRGEELWPPPGRVFAVGPAHSFMDLADAINVAFARWDLGHLSMFNLTDGRLVADVETAAEMAASPGGSIRTPLDITTTKFVAAVDLNDELQFVFDLGDEWIHRCVVGSERIDPVDVLGIRPAKPLPYWGWGSMPDQYGRQWADDDGASRPPRRPAQPHPMLSRAWPMQETPRGVDLSEVRSAIATGAADRFLAAVAGRDVDDVLQQVGAGIPMALQQRRVQAEPVALSVINRLTLRAAPGDDVLAEDLLSHLRGAAIEGRSVAVDLELLCEVMEGDPITSSGGYVDLHTGEVYDESVTDPMMVGEEAVIDVDEEPDRWLWIDRTGSREGRRDMEAFVGRQRDARLRERLERAIEGRGAFARFRDIVHQEGLAAQWTAYADDRRLGRAREVLAERGIRVG